MNRQIQGLLFKRLVMPFCFFICILHCNLADAQEHPPKPIMVNVDTFQHLSFGSFIQNGNNGEVIVYANGGRTVTGSIILPTFFSTITPALFEVKGIPGTLVTIVNGPNAELWSSNGKKMIMQIGDSYPLSPFTIPNSEKIDVKIGGILFVRSLMDNPEGDYSGTFTVTFIQQ
jgi:hypothetical protein